MLLNNRTMAPFLVLYIVVLLLLCTYGAHRAHLVWLCVRYRKQLRAALRHPEITESDLRTVTVQLPLFKKYPDEHYCPRPAVMNLPVWVRKQADGTCPPAKP